MPSAQGPPAPSEFEFRGELTPAPLDSEQNHDDEAFAVAAGDGGGGGVIVDELYFRDEETATMAEYLAHYNASGNTAWVAQVAEVCAEILDGHAVAAPPARVDQLSSRDLLVRRKKRHIDQIFNGARVASEEDCERAIKAFKGLWGPPPVPIKKLALWRLAQQLHQVRRNNLRIPARYQKTFLLTIFENEAEGQFIGLEEPEDELFRKLTEVFREVKDIVDTPIEF